MLDDGWFKKKYIFAARFKPEEKTLEGIYNKISYTIYSTIIFFYGESRRR
jgi:hypothetical protein